MSELGRQVKYGIGKGSDVAPTNWINHLSFDFAPKAEYVNNSSAYGVIERTNSSSVLRQWSEGSMEAKLTADNSGLILLGAFGTVVTSDNADTDASVKDHTFTINQDTAGQLFTFVRKDGLSTEKFTGARIGEWQLSMSLDDYIKYTASIMAQSGTTTTATPAYEASLTEFLPKHMSVKTAATAAGLGAASAVSTLESFTLTVNPNIEADYEAGSDTPYGFTSRGYEFSFEMTTRYDDRTYENAFKNGTELALQVSAVNTDVTIGAAANPSLTITAPKMSITDWSRSEDLDGPMTQTLTGTINYSAADAYALRAVLVNTTASYA